MILSQTCQYGIQATFYLALQGETPALCSDIATKLHIPQRFLANILQDLSRRALLLSFQGRGGGFRLARPADQIKLEEIVLAIEGENFGQKCVLGLDQCSQDIPCPLHAQWAPIKAAIWSMLRDKSVQQLVEDAAAGRKLLLPGLTIPKEILVSGG